MSDKKAKELTTFLNDTLDLKVKALTDRQFRSVFQTNMPAKVFKDILPNLDNIFGQNIEKKGGASGVPDKYIAIVNFDLINKRSVSIQTAATGFTVEELNQIQGGIVALHEMCHSVFPDDSHCTDPTCLFSSSAPPLVANGKNHIICQEPCLNHGIEEFLLFHAWIGDRFGYDRVSFCTWGKKATKFKKILQQSGYKAS